MVEVDAVSMMGRVVAGVRSSARVVKRRSWVVDCDCCCCGNLVVPPMERRKFWTIAEASWGRAALGEKGVLAGSKRTNHTKVC